MRIKIICGLWALAFATVLYAAASESNSNAGSGSTAAIPVAQNKAEADAMRLEGEKRFHANCGRCHAAPHKFPPRMMATIVRHMRVRATITNEDMRLVLYYMTQ
jgi:cytochrome c5